MLNNVKYIVFFLNNSCKYAKLKLGDTMKNNKGFATSFILFGLLVLFLLVLITLMFTMNNSASLNGKLKTDLVDNIERKTFTDEYKITYDYNILNHTFTSDGFINTGFIVDYDTNFTLNSMINLPSLGKRYLLFGDYNGTKAISIEIDSANKLRVWINGEYRGTSTETVSANTDIEISFTWNAKTKRFTLKSSGSNSNAVVTGTYNITGKTDKGLRVGSQDYRGTVEFNPYKINSLKISKMYVYTQKLSDIPTSITNATNTFNGWYKEQSFKNQVTSNTDVPRFATTYYAKWTTPLHSDNLLVGKSLTNSGSASFTKIDDTTYRIAVSDTYSGVQIPIATFTSGKTYILKFDIQKIGGQLVNIGGHSSAATQLEFTIDRETPNAVYLSPNQNMEGNNDTSVHSVWFKFTYNPSSASGANNGIYIQPNRGKTQAVTVDITNLALYEVN